MKLGAFSISLTVKDVNKSMAFYESLGFQAMGGDVKGGWVILKNESCIIGLFQGMFEKNMLTFNPGWNENAENLDTFTDIRELQNELKAKSIEFHSQADETTTGPAHFIIEDPDGNPILVDQHR